MNHFPRVHRRFTLLELLVVVAIISVLAAMLLPVLGKARESARTAQCGNNARQQAIAISMYAGDADDLLPLYMSDGYSSNHYYAWGSLMQGAYVPVDRVEGDIRFSGILACPGSEPTLNWTNEFGLRPGLNKQGQLRQIRTINHYNFSAFRPDYIQDPTMRVATHYAMNGMNEAFVGVWGIDSRSNFPFTSGYRTPAQRLGGEDKPGDTWMTGETIDHVSGLFNMAFPHGMRSNASYLDGHVVVQQPSELNINSENHILDEKRFYTRF